jgi:hypothetical protein
MSDAAASSSSSKIHDTSKEKTCVDISSSLKTSRYFQKDLLKFSKATKLIARGSTQSSSEAYRVAAGKLANVGTYEEGDIVGISAEGRRAGRISPDWNEVLKACNAKVQMFITDPKFIRNTSYNIGEQEVAQFLEAQGYQETQGDGNWKRK